MPGRVSWVLSAALVGAAALSVFSQAPGDTDRERAYRANNVGVALLEQFDYEAAARSFRAALKLHPSLDLARLNLAIALFYGGRTADAAAEARTAVERLPDAPQVHYVAGLIARAEDDPDAAAEEVGRFPFEPVGRAVQRHRDLQHRAGVDAIGQARGRP